MGLRLTAGIPHSKRLLAAHQMLQSSTELGYLTWSSMPLMVFKSARKSVEYIA